MYLCVLQLDTIPSSGIAMIDINLSSILKNPSNFNSEKYAFHAADRQGRVIHTCFIPDESASSLSTCSGKLIFFNLKNKEECLSVSLVEIDSKEELTGSRIVFGGGSIEFSDKLFLSNLTLANGETISFNFCDKLKRNLINSTWTYCEGNIGEYPLAITKSKILVRDAKLTVIRHYGEYIGTNGNPHSEITAYYDVYLFAELSSIYICANVKTNYPDMHALHFMELELSRGTYTSWRGAYPFQEAEIKSSTEGTVCLNHWTALSSDTHTLAYLSTGLCALSFEEKALRLNAHFDLARNGAYLQNNPAEVLDGWLYVSDERKSAEDIEDIYRNLPDTVRVLSINPYTEVTEGLYEIASGDIIAKMKIQNDGVSLFSLRDAKSCKLLTPCDARPLFRITLQDLVSGDTHQLTSNAGWSSVSVSSENDTHTFKLSGTEMLNGLSLTLIAEKRKNNAIAWTISLTSSSKQWSLLHLSITELPLCESWDQETVVYPKGAGSLLQNAWSCKPNLRNTYPSLFYCMQFLAAYGEYSDKSGTCSRGIYFGIHDAQGLRKEILADYQTKSKTINFGFVQQAPGAGEVLRQYENRTEVVWQLFDGDWFDAAMIYKNWALTFSDWSKRPPLQQKSPGWLSDTSVWLYANVLPENPVWEKSSAQAADGESPSWKEGIKKVSSLLGLPVAVHTYKWHQIPFDNDYPHYFPTREGFAEDVKELQSVGIKIMPYINARLWDTRDRENTDYQFTSMAISGVTKNRTGEPWRECYSSKEKDGSLVVLGVMCPSSGIWKQTLKTIVKRLYDEIGVDAVYMDQIAAAPPVPCFDQTHTHLPGIGGWWMDEYYQLVKELREVLPSHAVLTTECNADPFMNQFDGYLTWHWEYPDSIPLFPVVYSGKVRTFGRNYKKLDDSVATCMLAAQQLVYGDQIGWFEASIADKPYFPAIADMIRLRWRVRDYINSGEMCRPLQLKGVPEILTDFGWSAKKVCLPAVQNGIWRAHDKNSILILFANGSETDVVTTLDITLETYGLVTELLEAELISPDGVSEQFIVQHNFAKEFKINKQSSFALKLTSKINKK